MQYITYKRTFKNILALNFSSILAKFLGFFISIIFARKLGELYFGQLMFVFSFTGFFLVLNDFGLHSLVSRDIARNREISAKYLIEIGYLKLILSLILFLVFTGLLFLFPYSKELKSALFIGFLFVCIKSFGTFFNSFFAGFERLDINAILDFCFTFIVFIFIVLLSNFNVLTLNSTLVAYLLSIFLWFTTGYIILRKFISFDKVFFPKINLNFLRESYIFALGTISGNIILQTDVVILKFLKGDIPTGYYGVAVSFFSGLLFLTANFSNAVYPVFSRLFKESKEDLAKYFNKTFEIFFILILPLSIGGSILSEKIINFFYGKNYLPAVKSFVIILWAVFLVGIGTFFGTFLRATDRQSVLLKINIIGIIFNILSSIIFIYYLSHNGAGLSRALTLLFLAVSYYLVIVKDENYTRIFGYLIKPAISGLLMGIIVFLLKNTFNIFLLTFIGALSYFIFLILLRGFSKEEYNIVISFFKKVYSI